MDLHHHTGLGLSGDGLAARHRHRGPEEIIAFCCERLAHYKCPDAIEFGPLPKPSTGKVQKFRLRGREWAGQDQRISGV